jgi:hypothetical protein
MEGERRASMPLFINLFRDGRCLLEDQAAGDQSIELKLSEQDRALVGHLLAVESYAIARALGSLFMAGVREQHRASRRHCQPS